MLSHMRKLIVVLALPLTITVLLLMAITCSQPATARDQEFAYKATATAYLELSVVPPIVTSGFVITLDIAYHNIGFPYTYIQINPSNVVTFEPPLSMPCKYDQHPNNCSAITFRTLTTGVVTFDAGATGEVYDEICHCWYWSGASDNGPAIAIVADTIWPVFLPVIQR
jgi:hypothetical protein